MVQMVDWKGEFYAVKFKDPFYITEDNISVSCLEQGEMYHVQFADKEELKAFTNEVKRRVKNGQQSRGQGSNTKNR